MIVWLSLLPVAIAAGHPLDSARGALSRVEGQDPLTGVRLLLNATHAVTVFDHVSAASAGDVVTLTGHVTSKVKREQIETEIATVPGVRQIVNRITVLSGSASDEDLRRRVARAIYGHPSFRQYAAMSHPPIRVLVDRGSVSLAGQVATPVQRLVALSIAEGEVKGKVGDRLEVAGGAGLQAGGAGLQASR